ncbi:MAG: pseudouridine synthase [Acidimicrobiia bacterium]|nr:MAG: pseudouridine synthase [Acidimicrobiia bacterium]
MDGVALPVKPGLVYYLVYKPVGVVSTADDPQRRPTVVDLVPAGTRVYPVGRLDLESEGLMILTNDGELTELITHPRFGITKTYIAKVAGHPGRDVLAGLMDGVELDDGLARAQEVRLVDRSRDRSLVEVVMGEGRKREVRRMFASLGHEVVGLVRVAIGPLRDPTLAPGSWRPLSMDEVRQLYAAGGRQ